MCSPLAARKVGNVLPVRELRSTLLRLISVSGLPDGLICGWWGEGVIRVAGEFGFTWATTDFRDVIKK